MTELCNFSNLDKDQIDAVQNLEKDLGKRLLAYACHDIKLATLNSEELQKINALQKELGLMLVAVE